MVLWRVNVPGVGFLSSPSLGDFQTIPIGIIGKHLSLPRAINRRTGEMHSLSFQLRKERIEVLGTQFDRVLLSVRRLSRG